MRYLLVILMLVIAAPAFAEAPSCDAVMRLIDQFNDQGRNVNQLELVIKAYYGKIYKKCRPTSSLPPIYCFKCADAEPGQQGYIRIMEIREKGYGPGVDASIGRACFCDY